MNVFFYRSEYRKNRKNKDIVYYSEPMNNILRVSKEQFLLENPNLTEKDYEFFKAWSDSDLYNLHLHDRTEGRRRNPISNLQREHDNWGWMEQIDMDADLTLILSPVQERRLRMYYFDRYTMAEIAAFEGCSQQMISRSIKKAKEKIRKHFSRGV